MFLPSAAGWCCSGAPTGPCIPWWRTGRAYPSSPWQACPARSPLWQPDVHQRQTSELPAASQKWCPRRSLQKAPFSPSRRLRSPRQRWTDAWTLWPGRLCEDKLLTVNLKEVGQLVLHYLRFLPLRSTGLADLKVHPLDALCTSHDFYPAQVRLEIVEDAVCQLKEGLEPGVMRHVLRQVGQQNRHVKADVLKQTAAVMDWIQLSFISSWEKISTPICPISLFFPTHRVGKLLNHNKAHTSTLLAYFTTIFNWVPGIFCIRMGTSLHFFPQQLTLSSVLLHWNVLLSSTASTAQLEEMVYNQYHSHFALKKKKKSFFATPFSQEKTLTCLIWTVTFTLSSSWVQCRLVDIIVHTKYEQYQQEAQLLYQTWCSTHSLTLATRLFFFRLSTTLLSDSLFATKVIYLHILSWCLTLWIQSAAGLTKPFSEQKTALTLAGSWKRSTNSL